MVNPRIISFVARSKRRLQILELLQEGQMSQVEIMRSTKMYKTHTSRTLKELCDKRLIVCTNPKDRSFRYYKITHLGKRAIKDVQRVIKDK